MKDLVLRANQLGRQQAACNPVPAAPDALDQCLKGAETIILSKGLTNNFHFKLANLTHLCRRARQRRAGKVWGFPWWVGSGPHWAGWQWFVARRRYRTGERLRRGDALVLLR